MELLKHLITFFIKISFAFFVGAFVWWVVSLFVPMLNFHLLIPGRTATSTAASRDWLPSPRTYAGLFGARSTTPNENTNLYVAPDPFDGYNLNSNQYQYTTYNYVTYTSQGMSVTSGTKNGQPSSLQQDGATSGTNSNLPTQSPTTLLTNRALAIRNLSIYQGGHVYTGLSFIGEAKASMFREGKFPVVVVDQSGKVLGVSAARATSDWTVPGWIRFETKITYPLPSNIPCTMIFEEALTQQERIARQPLRVPVQVRCN